MKYHITITDNETEETLHDCDACAIMASVNEGDGTSDCMYTDCDFMDFLNTLVGICRLEKKIAEEHPGIISAARAMAEASQKKEPEETQNEE